MPKVGNTGKMIIYSQIFSLVYLPSFCNIDGLIYHRNNHVGATRATYELKYLHFVVEGQNCNRETKRHFGFPPQRFVY